MRKALLVAAALVALATTVEIKSAQAYPFGWTWSNAATCALHAGVGRAIGGKKMGEAAMDNCLSAFYGN